MVLDGGRGGFLCGTSECGGGIVGLLATFWGGAGCPVRRRKAASLAVKRGQERLRNAVGADLDAVLQAGRAYVRQGRGILGSA
jgi:hypothetical protein